MWIRLRLTECFPLGGAGLTWAECKAQCPEGVVPACHNSEDTVTISGPQVHPSATPLCYTTLLQPAATPHCYTTLIHHPVTARCYTTLLHHPVTPPCYTTLLHPYRTMTLSMENAMGTTTEHTQTLSFSRDGSSL